MTVLLQNQYYAPAYHFASTRSCRSYTLAYQHLYSNGPQDQKHTQRSCGDPGYHLASPGIWTVEFFKRPSSIKQFCFSLILPFGFSIRN